MAPNLRELSLKRMEITNSAFSEMTKDYCELTSLNISSCPLIEADSVNHCIQNNENLEKFIGNRAPKAINDNVVISLGALEHLRVLDISYSPEVTDEGLAVFKDRPRRLRSLQLNSLD